MANRILDRLWKIWHYRHTVAFAIGRMNRVYCYKCGNSRTFTTIGEN